MELKMMYPNAKECNIPSDKCSLAMAYVPWQKFERMYNEERAFKTGTAFPSLDFPFCAAGEMR